MLFKQFCEEHSLKVSDLQACQAKHDYKGTTVKAKYLHLSKVVEDQDYLILSRHAAEALAEGKIDVGDLDCKVGDNGKWGLIMPAHHDTWEGITLKL